MNSPVLCTAIVVQRIGFVGQIQVLLLRRHRTDGRWDPWDGNWCLPGGKVGFGEHPKDTAVRELYEETGLKVYRRDLRLMPDGVTSQVGGFNHIVGLIYQSYLIRGEPENREPDRHSELGWFGLDGLPKPLMSGVKEVLGWVRARAVEVGLAEPVPSVVPAFTDPMGGS